MPRMGSQSSFKHSQGPCWQHVQCAEVLHAIAAFGKLTTLEDGTSNTALVAGAGAGQAWAGAGPGAAGRWHLPLRQAAPGMPWLQVA